MNPKAGNEEEEKKKNPKVKSEKTYTQDSLEEAIANVKRGLMSWRHAAKLFNIPRSTLYNKWTGRVPMVAPIRTALSSQEEDQLEQWLLMADRRGCKRTKQQLLVQVQNMINKDDRTTPFADGKPGDKWYSNFLERHPTVSMRNMRHKGREHVTVSKKETRNWFADVERDFREFSGGSEIVNVPPQSMFTMAETGFPLNMDNKVVDDLSSDNSRQITVVACGSGSGKDLLPMIVFPDSYLNFDPTKQFPGSTFTITDNGWINEAACELWFLRVFIPMTKTLPKPIILLSRGHTAHYSMTIHNLCMEHSIYYHQLLLNTNPALRFFKKLKSQWNYQSAIFRIKHGDDTIANNFAIILKNVWEKSVSINIIVSGFLAAGLYPWNPDNIDFKEHGLNCSSSSTLPPTTLQTPTAHQPTPLSRTSTVTYTNTPEADTQQPSTSHFIPEASPTTSVSSIPSVAAIKTVFSINQLIQQVVAERWDMNRYMNTMNRLNRQEEPKDIGDDSYTHFLSLYRNIVPISSGDNLSTPSITMKKKTVVTPDVVSPQFNCGDGNQNHFQEKKQCEADEEQNKKEARKSMKRDVRGIKKNVYSQTPKQFKYL